MDLLAFTEQLMAIPSVSRDEDAIATFVAEYLAPFGHLDVVRVGDNVVARTAGDDAERIVVGGHLDTVPPHDGQSIRIVDNVLYGLGAADMKSSISIMVDLATTIERPRRPITWVFYAREEIGRAESGLEDLFAVPGLLSGAVALLLEPTDLAVEAGCQGTLRLEITMAGAPAHTARPFMGRNAIHRLAPVLATLASTQPAPVIVDGLSYGEQLQVVKVSGGTAGNVVPASASCAVNYRFAPTKSLEDAAAWVTSLIEHHLDREGGDTVVLADGAAGGMPNLNQPVIHELVAATAVTPVAKVGWTDVATFAQRGIPACNYGPGSPLVAHHADEHVRGDALVTARSVLENLLH